MGRTDDKKGSIIVVTGFKGGNYGTKLQSTALCKYFESLELDTSILDGFRYKGYFLLHPDIGLTRILKRIISRNDTKKFFDDKEHYFYSEDREKKLIAYENENYNPVCIVSKNQFKSILAKKPIFVVGSDIIWQPSMGVPGYWFLDFIYHTKLKRFSYATSIGANELPRKYNYFYKKYLKKFCAVGVREKTAVKLLKPIIPNNVIQVIDPTLLHNADFWSKFIEKIDLSHKEIEPCRYVFCYFVMHDPRYWDYMRLVEQYLKSNQETKDYKIIVLPMHRIDEAQPYTVITDGTPYEFVYLIKNASFIVTDSFHACAFSLNFKKEFYLLRRKRKDEDSKYDDFFLRYGLNDRNVTNEKVFVRNTEIDYETAHKRLTEDRKFAVDFIQSALSE